MAKPTTKAKPRAKPSKVLKAVEAAPSPRPVLSSSATHERNDNANLIPSLRDDFRNFLHLAWKEMNLEISEIEYDIADWLQNDLKKKQVRGMRGIGKSVICGAFIDWWLYKNPNDAILLVSSISDLADDLLRFSRKIIDAVPAFKFLAPGEWDLDGAGEFVTRARKIPQKDPSVRACGITTSKTGWHADLIICDDVESLENSKTVTRRADLMKRIEELVDLLNPGGTIVFLNTPQTEDSVYLALKKRGYLVRRWPARHKDPNDPRESEDVAPMLLQKVRDGKAKPGDPTYPSRFSEAYLQSKLDDYGQQRYNLQMECDPRLADKDRYPLRLRDLIVLPLHPDVAPTRVVWGTSDPVQDIEPNGLDGDCFYKPIFWNKLDLLDYECGVMFIDPAGGGKVSKDEVSWSVVKMLRGTLFALDSGGLSGGFTDYNLRTLANKAKQYGIKTVLLEENYGKGMFTKLLAPIMAEINGPTELIDVPSSNKQKELRIIDTLVPLLQQHRLVFDPRVARDTILTEQFTRITRVAGCLTHEDRLEALANACAWFIDKLPAVTAEEMERRSHEAADQAEAQKYLDTYKKRNGVFVAHGDIRPGVHPKAKPASRFMTKWHRRGQGTW